MRALAAEVEAIKAEPYTPTKPDVRMLDLPLGQQTYVRVNAAGVYTGTLCAWNIYPQHKLPVDSTLACLDGMKRVEVVHGYASQYQPQDGDLMFIDPPYVKTAGQYIDKSRRKDHQDTYDPSETIALVQSTSNPIIMTYGDGATVIFPDYEWKLVTTRRVPKIRTGGTVERSEWVAYINW